ncbi:hypothetical protein ACFWN7_12575 [Agromyces sp. NPDC058484]|uniref:hypothetical protein n=1 Tax=Agromyces sp. NPDC058484 TaxID=3346524 RepID=UPI003656C685
MRIGAAAASGVLHRNAAALSAARRRVRGPRHPESGVPVLDLVYVAVIIATFALVGLIAKGVEKL